MDLDETKVAERRANARNERVEAALQLTTAGVWDWDVEHGLTNDTDGYYRVFGVDPAFGARQHPDLAPAAGHRPGWRDRTIPRTASACRCRRPRSAKPNTASATPTEAGTGPLDRAYVVDRAPDGSTKRVLGLVVDITARKIRETALSAADQRFRAIARELRCVIYEIDAETGVSTGEGVERVVGYTNADLPGPGDWAALVHPDDQPLLKQWFDRSAETMVALQYRIRHRDGHYITLLDSPCGRA
jgi:PAS domain S-box-containing protein